MDSVPRLREDSFENKRELLANSYEIFFRAKAGENVVVRDDQCDFAWLLDSARSCRESHGRFSLIDSGKLDVFKLEWLAEAGANIYTSDRARRNNHELILLNQAAKKGKGSIAYVHRGTLEQGNETKTISFFDLREISRSGVFLHISNKDKERDISKLSELAYECRHGRSWLVYYHHRLLDWRLESLAQEGAWIHVSDYSLAKDEDVSLLVNIIQLARSKSANLILHVEKGMNVVWLHEVFRAGAFVLFQTLPSDYKSSLRVFELRAKKQKLDFRACYIYANFSL